MNYVKCFFHSSINSALELEMHGGEKDINDKWKFIFKIHNAKKSFTGKYKQGFKNLEFFNIKTYSVVSYITYHYNSAL